MPIPHGSNNLTEKNHNEILHLLAHYKENDLHLQKPQYS